MAATLLAGVAMSSDSDSKPVAQFERNSRSNSMARANAFSRVDPRVFFES